MNISNTKSNLKRSLKNKRNIRNVQLVDIEENELKEKEKIERAKNITYSKEENQRRNITVKSYKDKAIKTKISKEGYPPKRKNETNDNNNIKESSLKNDSNSENKLMEDVIIHKMKSGNKGKDIDSIDKKSITKDDFLIKEDTKTKFQLNAEKDGTKEETLTKKKDNILYDDYELNHLPYDQALQFDERLFIGIYWSLLKREHPIVHTFLAWNDHNLFFVKLSNFFFLITTIMAFDALFFSNDSMHNVYASGGSYNFGYHFAQMVLTIIVYEALQVLLNFLTLTDIDYYKIKAKKDTISQKEVVDFIKCIKYKLIGFYVFTFLVFLFYWYLNSAFCAVYEYTQGIFAVDSIVCFIFALIYPLVLYLAPTGLRKISFICQKTKNLGIVYKISQLIPIF